MVTDGTYIVVAIPIIRVWLQGVPLAFSSIVGEQFVSAIQFVAVRQPLRVQLMCIVEDNGEYIKHFFVLVVVV